tara:strand:- start:1167 stop:1487 length:321 start_codon:yes stop_codon:yes gene_type:complete
MNRLFGKSKANSDLSLITFIKNNEKQVYKCLEKDKLDDLKNYDKLIQKAKTQINNYKSYECTICMENDVNVCIVPCGHTFCSKCIKDANRCFICNSDIFMKQKMFI